jgi:predicted TIM-barrel fold metal-dependent hydrolase
MPGLVDVNVNPLCEPNGFIHLIDSTEAADQLDRSTAVRARDGDVHMLTPPLYYTLCNGIADNRRINDAMLRSASRNRALAFGVAEPKFGEVTYEEIGRLGISGAAGLVWSPRAQGIFADDQSLADLCRHVAGCHMISLIHAAPYSINEALWRIWNLGRRCKDLPLIIMGAFQSWEAIQIASDGKGGPENIFYEISGLSGARDLNSLVNAVGSGRLLFGSGGPRFQPGQRALVTASAMSSTNKEEILATNARALFARSLRTIVA